MQNQSNGKDDFVDIFSLPLPTNTLPKKDDRQSLTQDPFFAPLSSNNPRSNLSPASTTPSSRNNLLQNPFLATLPNTSTSATFHPPEDAPKQGKKDNNLIQDPFLAPLSHSIQNSHPPTSSIAPSLPPSLVSTHKGAKDKERHTINNQFQAPLPNPINKGTKSHMTYADLLLNSNPPTPLSPTLPAPVPHLSKRHGQKSKKTKGPPHSSLHSKPVKPQHNQDPFLAPLLTHTKVPPSHPLHLDNTSTSPTPIQMMSSSSSIPLSSSMDSTKISILDLFAAPLPTKTKPLNVDSIAPQNPSLNLYPFSAPLLNQARSLFSLPSTLTSKDSKAKHQSTPPTSDPFSAPLPKSTSSPTSQNIRHNLDPFLAPLPTQEKSPHKENIKKISASLSLDSISAPLPTPTRRDSSAKLPTTPLSSSTPKSHPSCDPAERISPTSQSLDTFPSLLPTQTTPKDSSAKRLTTTPSSLTAKSNFLNPSEKISATPQTLAPFSSPLPTPTPKDTSMKLLTPLPFSTTKSSYQDPSQKIPTTSQNLPLLTPTPSSSTAKATSPELSEKIPLTSQNLDPFSSPLPTPTPDGLPTTPLPTSPPFLTHKHPASTSPSFQTSPTSQTSEISSLPPPLSPHSSEESDLEEGEIQDDSPMPQAEHDQPCKLNQNRRRKKKKKKKKKKTQENNNTETKNTQFSTYNHPHDNNNQNSSKYDKQQINSNNQQNTYPSQQNKRHLDQIIDEKKEASHPQKRTRLDNLLFHHPHPPHHPPHHPHPPPHLPHTQNKHPKMEGKSKQKTQITNKMQQKPEQGKSLEPGKLSEEPKEKLSELGHLVGLSSLMDATPVINEDDMDVTNLKPDKDVVAQEENVQAKAQRKEKKKQKMEPSAPVKKNVCIHWMRGKCYVVNCNFDHSQAPPKKEEVCKFYMSNCCSKEDCLFSHDLKIVPCKYFNMKGYCSAGDMCKFGHFIAAPVLPLPPPQSVPAQHLLTFEQNELFQKEAGGISSQSPSPPHPSSPPPQTLPSPPVIPFHHFPPKSTPPLPSTTPSTLVSIPQSSFPVHPTTVLFHPHVQSPTFIAKPLTSLSTTKPPPPLMCTRISISDVAQQLEEGKLQTPNLFQLSTKLTPPIPPISSHPHSIHPHSNNPFTPSNFNPSHPSIHSHSMPLPSHSPSLQPTSSPPTDIPTLVPQPSSQYLPLPQISFSLSSFHSIPSSPTNPSFTTPLPQALQPTSHSSTMLLTSFPSTPSSASLPSSSSPPQLPLFQPISKTTPLFTSKTISSPSPTFGPSVADLLSEALLPN